MDLIKFNQYWAKQKNLVTWKKIPKKIYNNSKKQKYKWFEDGLLNVYSNCIEINQNKENNHLAIHFISKTLKLSSWTYDNLYYAVENFSIQLSNRIDVKKKQIIAIHASASKESVVAMLSCAKLGLTFSVIFEDLPIDSIFKRIEILKPSLFITRSDKSNILKRISIYLSKKKKLKTKFLIFSSSKFKKYDFIKTDELDLKKITGNQISTVFKKSNHPLFVLFTSGSTGDPKGIIHSTGGYFVFTKLTCKKQFGMNNNSVVLTASDAGWINGHTYALFGPLSFGATTVILEKPLSLLNENLIKDVLYELKVNILYLPVTIIRILKSIYNNKQFIKNNLIAIGSMGEPLAKDVAKWFSYSFSNSNLPIVNTYFQTETGGIISSPKYNSKNIKKTFGTVGRTTTSYIELNINFNKKILNKKKKFLKEITIKTPWPGCMIGIVNGTKMFNKYWNNSRDFKLFDVGFLNKDKFLEIVGRSDDVINIRGHRVGSGEIESELIKISGISEVCAIGLKDELEGNRLVIFFSRTNKKRKQNFTKNINKLLSNIFGNYLLPKHIVELSSLPKTKSGKILRRVLKNLIENPNSNQIGDTSTILDSQIIVEARNKILNKLDF